MLDLESKPKPGRANGRRPAALLADDRFRRAIGVNEHDGHTWFNKERFDNAVTWLALADAADLKAAAKKSGYELDKLDKLLSKPPNWASTTPVRAGAAGARRTSGAAAVARSKPSNKAAKK
jgi:hypothetical protein